MFYIINLFELSLEIQFFVRYQRIRFLDFLVMSFELFQLFLKDFERSRKGWRQVIPMFQN